MPIAKKWSRFNKENVEKVPEIYGVYEFGNRSGNEIYIGHAKLRSRMVRHLHWKSDGTIGEKTILL